MYEYDIYNKQADERTTIFGYSFTDACRRSKLDKEDWIILHQEYID